MQRFLSCRNRWRHLDCVGGESGDGALAAWLLLCVDDSRGDVEGGAIGDVLSATSRNAMHANCILL
jgi:hypothetical protein